MECDKHIVVLWLQFSQEPRKRPAIQVCELAQFQGRNKAIARFNLSDCGAWNADVVRRGLLTFAGKFPCFPQSAG